MPAHRVVFIVCRDVVFLHLPQAVRLGTASEMTLENGDLQFSNALCPDYVGWLCLALVVTNLSRFVLTELDQASPLLADPVADCMARLLPRSISSLESRGR